MRFFRDAGNITMDLDDVEQIDLDALGGVDNLVVNDMTRTDLVTMNSDLEGAFGSGTGDGQIDTVTVNGTNGDDAITVSGAAGSATVAGLAPTVNITSAEPTDRLVIDTLAGNDSVDSTGLAPNTIELVVV